MKYYFRNFHACFLIPLTVLLCSFFFPLHAAAASYCGDQEFSARITKELSGDRQTSGGKIYYVSTTGKNSWKGTKTKPFRTISYAVRQLRPGDTLYLRGGTYHETLSLSSRIKGTKKRYITISNYADEKVIISGEQKSAPTLLSINGSSYLRICGLEFTDAAGQDACGIYVASGSHHLIFRENKIHDITVENPSEEDHCSNGILFFGDSPKKSIHDVLLYKNKFYDCQTGWAECVAVTANCTNINIISNEIKNTGNIGIDLSGNYGYCSEPSKDFPRNCLVTKNKVSNCVSAYATSYGIYVDGGQRITISQNQVKNCSGGIEIGAEEKPQKIAYSTSDITVSGNTLQNNIENAITVGGYEKNLGWVKNVVIQNNKCLNNGKENAILTLSKCDGILISGNRFCNNSGNAAIVYSEFSNRYTKNITFSDNSYFNGHPKDDTLFVYHGKEYTSFKDWKSVVGKKAGTYRK